MRNAQPDSQPTPSRQCIAIARIRTDGGTQMRVESTRDIIEDYRERLRDGADFPPIILFHDRRHFWLADGFCRLEARRLEGEKDILADVYPGGQRDAVLYACGANATHGRQRTNADKRKSAFTLLKDSEWSQWSNGEIARRCGVSPRFVGLLRTEMAGPSATMNGSQLQRTVQKPGLAPYTMNVGAIGANRIASLPPSEQAAELTLAEQAARDRIAREEQAEAEAKANAPVRVTLALDRALAERIDAVARRKNCNREWLCLWALAAAFPEPRGGAKRKGRAA